MDKRAQTPLLVVEDSDEDFEILQILMEDMNVNHPIHRCKTGDLALEFIEQYREAVDSQGVQPPSMIMLDLNLPGIDGREVLAHLKQDDQLKSVPVVIFTTSSDPVDIRYCYKKGANGYLIKPVSTERLEEKVKAFVDFWLGANTMPPWDYLPAMA